MTTLTTASIPMAGPIGSPQSRPAPSPAGGLSGADILQVIRQRFVMIFFVWLLVAVMGVAATILIRKYRPIYEAKAFIQVLSNAPVNPVDPMHQDKVLETEMERMLQDQALRIKTPGVLQAAVEDAELRTTQWYKDADAKHRAKNEDPRDLLEDIIVATPIRDSNYFYVSASWRVAEDLPKIVNTIVEKYMALIEKEQKENIRNRTKQLDTELETATKQYEAATKGLEQYRSDNYLLAGGHEEDEKVKTLNALVTELEVEMLGKRSIYEQYDNAKPGEMPITAELFQLLESDPVLYQLQQQFNMAEQNLSELAVKYGPKHRIYTEQKNTRDALAQRILSDRSQKTMKFQEQQIESAKREFLDASQQLLSLKDKLSLAQAAQKDKEAHYAQYYKMIDEADLKKKQLEQLGEQRHVLGIVQCAEKSMQIDVRQKAVKPTRISQPKLEIFIPVSVLFGMGVAVGLALLLEVSDKSIRTPRDVQRQSMSVLGVIPTADDDEVEIERVETACLDAPRSIVAEGFRNLRANLFFLRAPEHQAVLLVSSPSGGNGKTTVATNLAISIALSGRRVLLIDANFRRSALHRLFPGTREEGLSNLLIGQGRLDDYVTPTTTPGLEVLSAGPIPPNPAELFGSAALRDLIVDARARYDQIIFDGPPVLLVSDALVLSGSMDGVIVVAQYRTTSRGALQRTKQQLDAVNARLFGVVINMVQTRAGGYLRKNYREFYEYHEMEEIEGQAQRRHLDTSQAEQVGFAAGAADRSDPGNPHLPASAESSATQVATAAPAAADWAEPVVDLSAEIDQITGDLPLGEEDEFKIDGLDDLENPGGSGHHGGASPA